MVARGVPARRRARRRLMTTALALACAASTATSAVAAPRRAPSPIGVHSMLYLNTPVGAEQVMFREAAGLGASTIRLDIALSGVFPTPSGPPDWTGVDQYMALAHQYHLRVLADLLATPAYMADCATPAQAALSYRCPPLSPSAWGRDAGLIAAHTRGVIDDFEIINEPDNGQFFYGTAQQYAHILACSYRAIHAADPAAEVALGGLMMVWTHAWLHAMLSTPGVDAIHSFDLANIHVRGAAAEAGPTVAGWRHYMAREGFHGPLWVTETGYPADAAWQTDPGYRDGPPAQARWMTDAIPAMLGAGAAMVFVTERDALTGPFASEGVLQSPDPLPADPVVTPRPSYYAVRALIRTLAQCGGQTRTVASPLRMIRLPFCVASEDTVARSPSTSRTVRVTTTSSSITPMPRN
jgi:hypothetical protein